jgi:hypothetical protein
MGPSCEFLSSIQKRYLGFLAALHTQPKWRLVEVSTVASKSCVVKSAPLPAPYSIMARRQDLVVVPAGWQRRHLTGL